MEKLIKKQKRQTVKPTVYKRWQKLKTFGDVKNIIDIIIQRQKETGEKIPHSQPTITAAIRQGFVFKPVLEEIINQYYTDKMQKLTDSQKHLLTKFKEVE